MRTLAQVRSMLAEAGFEVVPGEHTFGTGWVVFQTRKGPEGKQTTRGDS